MLDNSKGGGQESRAFSGPVVGEMAASGDFEDGRRVCSFQHGPCG